LLEAGEGFRPDRGRNGILRFLDRGDDREQQLLALGGVAGDLHATVAGIVDEPDVPEFDELGDELSRRLFRHPGAAGDIADPRPVLVDVAN
jgi:hypothetical protein